MHYWNKDNFEGLDALSTQLRVEHGFESLADYCSSKAKGLKKAANQHAACFAKEMAGWPVTKQRTAAEFLVGLQHQHSYIHQFLSHPVRILVLDILLVWTSSKSQTAVSHRCLGLMTNQAEHFEKALTLDPSDQISIRALVQHQLSSVDHQTHHLDEGLFIGAEADAVESLRLAEGLLERLEEAQGRSYLAEELTYYQSLVSEWLHFSKAAPADQGFTDWCKARGRSYSFPSRVYY